MKNGNNSRDVPLMFAFSGSANLRALPKIWRFAGAVERSCNSSPSQSLTTRWVQIRLFEPQRLFPPLDYLATAAVQRATFCGSQVRLRICSGRWPVAPNFYPQSGANIYAPPLKKARLGAGL